MSDFAVVIGFKFNNEEYQSIVLDTVGDVSVGGSSRITEQPVVSGDLISDHMYTEPKTLNLSGSISINDSKVTVVTGSGSKLANFEELFERIQKEGVRCDIVKISMKNEDDIRFLHRENMVVQRFGWTERINSLDYSMSFKQVMTTSVITTDVDIDDQYLPNVTEPLTLSFSDTLINWDEINLNVVNMLTKEGLLKENFLQALKSMGESTLKSICVGAVAIVLAALLSAIGATGGLAAVLLIAVAAAAIFIKGIINFFKRIINAKKYQIAAFEWSKDSKKNNSEVNRFGTLLTELQTEISKLDTSIHLYRISENTDQECMINIGDSYYIFTFTKNNTNGKYGLKVIEGMSSSSGDKVVASNTDITTSPSSFDKLTNNNMVFTASNNAKVYVLYNPIKEEDEENTNETPDELNLKNYCILVSDIDIESFSEIVTKIIKSKIFKKVQE